jgi:hypothetical protein
MDLLHDIDNFGSELVEPVFTSHTAHKPRIPGLDGVRRCRHGSLSVLMQAADRLTQLARLPFTDLAAASTRNPRE